MGCWATGCWCWRGPVTGFGLEMEGICTERPFFYPICSCSLAISGPQWAGRTPGWGESSESLAQPPRRQQVPYGQMRKLQHSLSVTRLKSHRWKNPAAQTPGSRHFQEILKGKQGKSKQGMMRGGRMRGRWGTIKLCRYCFKRQGQS